MGNGPAEQRGPAPPWTAAVHPAPPQGAPGRTGESLIDAAVAAAAGRRPREAGRLDDFLKTTDPSEALRKWIAWSLPPGRTADRADILRLLDRDIGRLDRLLSGQVNAILHHRRFQKLEASWRGLHYLVDQASDVEDLKIRVLNLPWNELARDLERASEFDQSQFFRKVYSEEFDTPGGEPFGAILGDYEIHPKPSRGHPTDDVGLLAMISHVAAAAFAPFIAAAHPSMFELEDFRALERPLDLSKTHEQLDYLKWRSFRETEDARFIGLTLPRILIRRPYEDDGSRVDRFLFREDAADGDDYLWANATYAFGAVLARAFGQSRWLAGIRGVRRSAESGGLVSGLPIHCFSTDLEGIAPKCSTEVMITDQLEQQLSQLGFLPLSHCWGTELSAFYTTSSVQKPKTYDEVAASVNARISAMLQYMFCVSRFAHYVKVIARDKIGSFAEAEECERFLNDWLHRYVTSDAEASPEVKAEYPLREATVRVREHPGKPGCYLCVAHLWPHFELEELAGSVKVTTELSPGQPV